MPTTNKTGYPSIDKPWLKYYSSGFLDKNKLSKTVYQYVAENNSMHLDSIALKYKGVEISYKTLLDNVENIAESMANFGLRCDDKVMIAATGIPEAVYILLACSKLGICAEMINFSLDSNSIKNHIKNSEAKLVFCMDRIHEKIKNILWEKNIETVVIPAAQTLSPVVRFLDGLAHKIDKSHEKTIAYTDFLLKKVNYDSVTVNEMGQPYIVVYTSGTTGVPKGIVHTNRSYTAIAEEYRLCEYPFDRGDCFLNQLPFFIASALSFFTLAPVILGVTVILEPEYDPEVWIKDIVKYKPGVIFGTPSFWKAILGNTKLKVKDLSFAKIIISGAEPLDVETEQKINKYLLERHFKEKLTVGYGMSELNGTITTSSPKYHKEGSNGIPLPDVVVGIFDAQTRNELAYDSIGELMVQSPCAMKEYANSPENTAHYWWEDSQGRVWARTGDVGKIDENGEVYVFGRASESIEVDNRIFYFFEIESQIMQVESIKECKVVVSDSGILMINYIIKQGDFDCADELADNIRSKFGLSSKDIKLQRWDKFPLNANGKVDKLKLKNVKA